METVVLIVHLFLALSLIAVVLMQRSEGGGLGMGGGGGGLTTGRAAATALGKVTWYLAAAFIVTSISLSLIAAMESRGASVLDRTDGGVTAPAEVDSGLGSEGLVPTLPGADGDALVPEVEPVVPEADVAVPEAPPAEEGEAPASE